MRRDPACEPCVLDDLSAVLELLGTVPAQRLAIVGQARAQLAATWSKNRIPGEHIADAHRLLKRALGLPHPFREARQRANQVGLELAAQAARDAPAGDDRARLGWLVRWAISGNLLDFRICGYDLDAATVARLLRQTFDEGLAIDEVDRLLEAARGAREILYIHDNVGEVAFDKELIRELLRLAPGARVTSALRGDVMTSDATVDDGRAVGLAEVAQIIASGPDTLGISFAEMTDQMRAAIARADLVISKGQANFYVMDERPREVPAPIMCLLRTKCMVVSRHLGFDRIVNVAKWLTPPPASVY
ncbi:MAG TPA: ARMT1-like domain-containing protein [Polyangia bacterium]|nr:ARMT1-like domain-containing protein [Polyangia bacterium]